MRLLMAYMLILCIMMIAAVMVGTHAAEMAQSQFDHVNEILQGAGL